MTLGHLRLFGAFIIAQGLLIPQLTPAAETQQPPVPTTKKSESPVDESKRADAARRFDRALRLFDSGDNAGALAEFKRAYDLLPQPVVLYNIGLVYAAMSRPVDAADALEQVVNDVRLSTDQLQRAQRTLQEQQARIGRLAVTTKPEKAHVEVDNVEVAQTPLVAPIRVSEGNHIVGVVAEGYAPMRKEILLAGNTDVALNFELSSVRSAQVANLSVQSRVRDAELFVDDRLVGKTPLPTSVALAAGHHRVDLRRPGYVTAQRELDVGEGAVAEQDQGIWGRVCVSFSDAAPVNAPSLAQRTCSTSTPRTCSTSTVKNFAVVPKTIVTHRATHIPWQPKMVFDNSSGVAVASQQTLRSLENTCVQFG